MARAPEKQGLYDPGNEHDSCGVGFIANIKGEKSNDIVRDGLLMLANLDHRGAPDRTGEGLGLCKKSAQRAKRNAKFVAVARFVDRSRPQIASMGGTVRVTMRTRDTAVPAVRATHLHGWPTTLFLFFSVSPCLRGE